MNQKIYFLLAACVLSFVLQAILLPAVFGQRNHYVSHLGDDVTNNGLSTVEPWKTLSKVMGVMNNFNPGDSILFERGGIYDGGLQIFVSGQPGLPIVFGAYGTGAKPIFKSSNSIYNWTHVSGHLYKRTCASCTSRPHSLYINGVPQPIGRYPNADAPNKGYLTIDQGQGKTILVDQGPGFPNQYWNDGEVVIRGTRWILDMATIQNFQNDTLYLNQPVTSDIKTGWGYFFQNHIHTLDQNGEWSFDPTTKEIYLYSHSHPNLADIEISYHSSNIITSTISYVEFHDLELRGAQDVAIKAIQSDGLKFSNLTIRGAGTDAIVLNGCNGTTVEHCIIDNTNNNGIVAFGGSDGHFLYNTINKTGINPGMGENGNDAYTALLVKGDRNHIEHNKIKEVGYNGIRFEGVDNVIKKNFIRYACMELDDGAGIYTWHDGVGPTGGNVIEENIIVHVDGNGMGTPEPNKKVAQGIYIDDRSYDVQIKNNTVGYVGDNGILIHNSRKAHIKHNTVFGAGENQIFLLHDLIAGPGYVIAETAVDSNILVSAKPKTPTLHIRTFQNDLDSFGVFNHNLHINPFDTLLMETAWAPFYPASGPIVERFIDPLMGFTGQTNVVTDRPGIFYKTRWADKHLGPELISNSNFISDINDWTCWGSFNNNCNLHWSPTSLDSGALEVGFYATPGYSFVDTYHELGQIDQGKTYELSYTAQSLSGWQRIEISLEENGPPYGVVKTSEAVPVGTVKKDYSYIFTATTSSPIARLTVRVFEGIQFLYLDNVHLREVVVDSAKNPEVFIVYNEEDYPRNFPINGSYMDPLGNTHCSNVTLNAFESLVLMSIPPLSKEPIYTGNTLLYQTKQVSGCGWKTLTDPAQKPLVSIETNNQTLGQVLVNTYTHPGPVRVVNAKQVLLRNWVMSSASPPQYPVKVRLFITRDEIKALTNADPNVKKIGDLGITQFSSSATYMLNDSFPDNTVGTFTFHQPQDITFLPYQNGFYLEVEVSNLGEFWVGAEMVPPGNILAENFLSIRGKQIAPQSAKVNWTTVESDQIKIYEIERRFESQNWTTVATVYPSGKGGYEHIDNLPEPYRGPVRYRIKAVDQDGTFTYSPQAEIRFEIILPGIMVFPNPATETLSITWSTQQETDAQIRIYDAIGKLVWESNPLVSGPTVKIPVRDWQPGIYMVQVSVENISKVVSVQVR